MNDREKSAEPFGPMPTDGGGKVEPSVPTAHLIERLNLEIGYIDRTYRATEYRTGLKQGLSRAIKIIQANEGS